METQAFSSDPTQRYPAGKPWGFGEKPEGMRGHVVLGMDPTGSFTIKRHRYPQKGCGRKDG
jgi:hypothetical protein